MHSTTHQHIKNKQNTKLVSNFIIVVIQIWTSKQNKHIDCIIELELEISMTQCDFKDKIIIIQSNKNKQWQTGFTKQAKSQKNKSSDFIVLSHRFFQSPWFKHYKHTEKNKLYHFHAHRKPTERDSGPRFHILCTLWTGNSLNNGPKQFKHFKIRTQLAHCWFFII